MIVISTDLNFNNLSVFIQLAMIVSNYIPVPSVLKKYKLYSLTTYLW
jgi:hypothetical protein